MIETVLQYIERNNMQTYIEAGANDGIFQSRSIKYKDNTDYYGILIEPVPDVYDSCFKNRHSKYCKVINCALVPFDYHNNNIEICVHSLHSAMSTVTSIEDSEVSKRYTVPAKTLTNILEEENIFHINEFFLDVEGYEFQVLNGIDFDKIRIDMIEIELHNSLPNIQMTRDEEVQMHTNFLSNFGYTISKEKDSNQHEKVIARYV